MATRTIVTSQPDVACEVCERRLLRGEQPDVFIAAGRRLIVCELCAPRAAHEGWTRESETRSVSLPPLRPRRGRSFLDRLRQVGRPVLEDAADEAAEGAVAPEPELPSYDFMAAAEPVPAVPRGRSPRPTGANTLAQRPAADDAELEAGLDEREPEAPSYVEQALEVFNASEFPRRVAGVARSLGAPEVSARSAEHLSSVVVIVVAWELCWYRYEVDLSDGMAEVRVLEQGTELGQLARDDRLANALAGDSGSLSLTVR
ncbi:MAG TPA: hypothetical protein VN772_04315 [Solirubrobacteraceae bacterium]|nr:hypothetical protein [Solirubrobacteraceae bacterium]